MEQSDDMQHLKLHKDSDLKLGANSSQNAPGDFVVVVVVVSLSRARSLPLTRPLSLFLSLSFSMFTIVFESVLVP